MIRALITRPAEDAADIARALEARGVAVTIEPLLTIRPKAGVRIDMTGVQALLFTSANGARTFAEKSAVRDLPAFAVGDVSAEVLRQLGFSRVESAGGNIDELERLVRSRLDPKRGKLLHAAGTSVAGDLAGRLTRAGFAVERLQLYDAEPAQELGEAARAEIAAGRIDWVLVFSPRTAAAFASVVERAGLAEAARTMTLVALSDAVAKAAALPFRDIAVAADPTRAAVLAMVDDLIAAKVLMTETKPAAPPPPPRRSAPLLVAAVTGAVVAAAVAGAVIVPWQHLGIAVAPMIAVAAVDLAPLTQRLDKVEAAVAALGRRLDGVAAEAERAGAKASAAAEAAAARPAESPAAAAPVDLGPIEKKLASLEQSLAAAVAAATRPGEPPPVVVPVDLGPIEKKLAALDQSLAELGRRAAANADAERRLIEVERLARTDRRLDVTALAALKIGEALASGRPYKAELALLAGVAAIEAEVKALSVRAEVGVSTRAALIERFAAAAAAAMRSADPGDDLWSQAIAKLKGLVSVRRVAPGDDLDGRLARAERALGAGDLAQALAALDGLPEGAANALAAWRADAEARLAAERALDRTIQALAAGLPRAG